METLSVVEPSRTAVSLQLGFRRPSHPVGLDSSKHQTIIMPCLPGNITVATRSKLRENFFDSFGIDRCVPSESLSIPGA
jgi:hypothetical protein